MLCETGSVLVQEGSPLIEEKKMVERDERAARILGGRFVRADANPSDAAVDSMCSWFCADAANSDYGIKRPRANASHAAVNAEAAACVRITRVRALVDKGAHSDAE
jgi:hypothetical protein